ncbi:MAG: tetratricopeptide repeat protein [Flavobacteriales bacterium]|nr:tetratricopeptide repeat protein [Flavobacteriales bacterium]
MRTLLMLLICLLGWSAMKAQIDQASESFAIAKYQECLDLLEGDYTPEACMLRADAHHKLQELTAAIEQYDLAEEYGYPNLDLYLHRGICLVTLELLDQAEIDLLTYFTSNPDNPKVHYYLAAVDYYDANYREALFHLDVAIDKDKSYMDAYVLRAAVLSAQNKKLSAQKAFEECLDMDPNNERAMLNLAIIQLDLLQPQKAIELLNQLVKMETEYKAEALYYRGLAFESTHDRDSACGDWNTASELGDEYATELVEQVCEKGKKAPRNRRKTSVSF